MIRTRCRYTNKDSERCTNVTRARRKHDFCRLHHKMMLGFSRPIPHHIKKERVVKKKAIPVPVEKKSRK